MAIKKLMLVLKGASYCAINDKFETIRNIIQGEKEIRKKSEQGEEIFVI